MRLSEAISHILETDFRDTPAYKNKDVEVIKVYSWNSREHPWKPWPGKQKNVQFWVVLANGKAVGWNESGTWGWSFPLIRYNENA